jgi:hypothetical protein
MASQKCACHFEVTQLMFINRPGASPDHQVYKTNILKTGLGPTWVWSERDGRPPESRFY